MAKQEKKDTKVVSSGIDVQKIIDTINNGYIVKRTGKHQTKKTFAPSTIAYSHGE